MAVNWTSTFKLNPPNSENPKYGALGIRLTREAVQERFVNEHSMIDTGTDGTAGEDGWHHLGSAVIFSQATEPTTRNGETLELLGVGDKGRLWWDETNSVLMLHSGTEWTSMLEKFALTYDVSNYISIGDTLLTISLNESVFEFSDISVGGETYDDTALVTKGYVDKEIAETIIAAGSAATEETAGVLYLATSAQAVTGTESGAYAVTPATLTARLDAPGAIGGTTPGSFAGTTISGTTITATTGLVAPQLTRTGSFELTASGNITLNADGGYIYLYDATTYFGALANNAGHLLLRSGASGTNVYHYDGTKSRLYHKTIMPYISLDNGDNYLACKIIEIGDWNMDTTAGVYINHSLTSTKIRSVEALIRSDGDSTLRPINMGNASGVLGGYTQTTPTQIWLVRVEDGIFDNSSFDATSFNRGWITIWYVE